MQSYFRKDENDFSRELRSEIGSGRHGLVSGLCHSLPSDLGTLECLARLRFRVFRARRIRIRNDYGDLASSGFHVYKRLLDTREKRPFSSGRNRISDFSAGPAIC